MPLSVPAAALTYPTFAWDQYGGGVTAITVAGGGEQYLPLDTTGGASVTNPAGWTVDTGTLLVPNGVYACLWYWESADAGELWNNYAEAAGVPTGRIYPTAPMAITDSAWGSVSFTVKLSAGSSNLLGFYVVNADGSPHDITNQIVVTRLDA
jgi:hypothetical protein